MLHGARRVATLVASPVRLLAATMSTASANAPAPPTHVRVALCQLLTNGVKADSLRVAVDAIAAAAAEGAKIVSLPEIFNRCGWRQRRRQTTALHAASG